MPSWVVVGGGSAGCVVAARLSERSGDHVLLLEAGPDHAAPASADDVGPYLVDPNRIRSDVVHRRVAGASETYLRGHGLGGTSLINGGVVTDPASPVDVRIPLAEPWPDGPVGGALLSSDPRARRVRLIRHGTTRATAADNYIRPVMGRPNLEVRTGVEVRRILLAGRSARGVVTADGTTVRADRVVMCAGAIQTPAVLLRSGVDTPGIGHDLQDHPAFVLSLRLRPAVVDETVPTISVAATYPEHQVVALNHVAGSPDLGGLVVALTATRGRGKVLLPEPNGEPIVDLRNLADASDIDALASGVADAIELLAHDAWAGVVDGVYVDDLGTPLDAIAGSPGEIMAWVGEHLGGHYHAAATCREGVVTDGGRVRGYDDLYVADASALPDLPRHDPYLHIVAQADRLAASWP